ncbi:MAG: nucleoside transporter C-terminal domain-containing protein [Pirellulaceae bacterium]
MLYRVISLAGLFVMFGIAWMLSENRRSIRPRIVGWGVGLQFALALFVLKTAPGRRIFEWARNLFEGLIACSDAGASFLFGSLTTDASFGATVAFRALPIIIFVSALSGVLYHLRVIQRVVKAMAWVMRKTMDISGAESLAAALFVFLGIESVTAIDRYIKTMTRSELFVVMTAFMATIATSVMMIYSMFGASPGHLLGASLMSAPAAIAIAKIMLPETESPVTVGKVEFEPEVDSVNVLDAAAAGAGNGAKLVINIAAMLIAFVGLVALINTLLGLVHLQLQTLFGYAFAPFAALMGVPFEDVIQVGQLLGTKTVLNEFLAYQNMQGMMEELKPRSVTIATYALCGFANFGSVAILIGGIGGLVPTRRGEVAALAVKALIAGTLAAFTTACVAGILV